MVIELGARIEVGGWEGGRWIEGSAKEKTMTSHLPRNVADGIR